MRECGINGCTKKHNKLLHSNEKPHEDRGDMSETHTSSRTSDGV